jgi:hopanoid biosynthesis associated protein HpnK
VREMPPPRSERHLIAVADDFGVSSSVDSAIAEAHDAGVLTAASLMASGNAFQEAVSIALERPALSVGLHVTLCDGRSVLPETEIPALVGPDGRFEKSPVKAWLKYRGPQTLGQIEREIEAQVERLEDSGIHPSHMDCHHHLHMQPAVFEIFCRVAARKGIRWIRIPWEPLRQALAIRSLARGAMPLLEWTVFGTLRISHMKTACEHGLRAVRRTYGLFQTGQITENYVLAGLDRMADPLNEIFTHPDLSTGQGRRELKVLTSARVRERILSLGIRLAGYRELAGEAEAFSSAWGRA